MRTSAKLIDTCNRLFSGVSESQSESVSVLISYFGHFNQENLNHLLFQTEEHLVAGNELKKITKRVFSIVVEGLQNIITHGQSTEDLHKLGFYTLSKDDKGYHMYFGNIVDQIDLIRIEKELTTINAMTSEDLKAYHRQVLVGGKISEKGGAGLGLIISRMKTSEDIEFTYTHISSNLYFCSFAARVCFEA